MGHAWLGGLYLAGKLAFAPILTPLPALQCKSPTLILSYHTQSVHNQLKASKPVPLGSGQVGYPLSYTLASQKFGASSKILA